MSVGCMGAAHAARTLELFAIQAARWARYWGTQCFGAGSVCNRLAGTRPA